MAKYILSVSDNSRGMRTLREGAPKRFDDDFSFTPDTFSSHPLKLSGGYHERIYVLEMMKSQSHLQQT